MGTHSPRSSSVNSQGGTAAETGACLKRCEMVTLGWEWMGSIPVEEDLGN